MLNIVQSYNVFSPLHYTAVFEALKFSLFSFFLRFHSIIVIWNKEELPEESKVSIIVPIHNKADKTDSNNCRGISILPTTYKILSNILLSG